MRARPTSMLVLTLLCGASVTHAQAGTGAAIPAATPAPPPPPPPPPVDASGGSTPAAPPSAALSQPTSPPPAGPNAAGSDAAATPAPAAATALGPSSPDLAWHQPAESERFVPPSSAERQRPAHFIPSLRFRAMYMLEEEELEVEASVRAGTEAIAGTFGVVTIGGDPVPLAGVEGFGFFGIDAFDEHGLSGQVLLPDVSVSLAFDRELVLRAGSGLSGFRLDQCMGPVSLVGQLRLPIIDVWMVPDDDFEDPLISVGAMLEIGLAL